MHQDVQHRLIRLAGARPRCARAQKFPNAVEFETAQQAAVQNHHPGIDETHRPVGFRMGRPAGRQRCRAMQHRLPRATNDHIAVDRDHPLEKVPAQDFQQSKGREQTFGRADHLARIVIDRGHCHIVGGGEMHIVAMFPDHGFGQLRQRLDAAVDRNNREGPVRVVAAQAALHHDEPGGKVVADHGAQHRVLLRGQRFEFEVGNQISRRLHHDFWATMSSKRARGKTSRRPPSVQLMIWIPSCRKRLRTIS